MTENNRRAYGIGKDAYTTGEDLDDMLDWAAAEGIIRDTAAADLHGRMGWEAARLATV